MSVRRINGGFCHKKMLPRSQKNLESSNIRSDPGGPRSSDVGDVALTTRRVKSYGHATEARKARSWQRMGMHLTKTAGLSELEIESLSSEWRKIGGSLSHFEESNIYLGECPILGTSFPIGQLANSRIESKNISELRSFITSSLHDARALHSSFIIPHSSFPLAWHGSLHRGRMSFI